MDIVADVAGANPVTLHEKNPIGYAPGSGAAGRLDGDMRPRLAKPPLAVLNVICPVPDGGVIETVGATYVIDIVDTVVSLAESVALTSIVCGPRESAPVANDQVT